MTCGSGIAARPDVRLRLDHELTDAQPADGDGQIDRQLADSGYHREVVFHHRASRTLILTDLVENFEPAQMPWWVLLLLKLSQVWDTDGRIPRDMAASFRPRRPHLRGVVETMIAQALERVIMAHGRWCARAGVAELRRALQDVLPG